MLPGVGKKGSVVLSLLRPNGEYKHNFESSHFFSLSRGRENLSAAGRQNECLSADGWFSWNCWRNHQVHKHLNLYSNTMALMQSEASVHWGWDLGTSVLSTFQA